MTHLSAAYLREYNWRAEVFIKKIHNRTTFEVAGGRKVVLIMPKNGEHVLRKGSNVELTALRFADSKGGVYKLTDFVKSLEFGGRYNRRPLGRESKEVTSLRQQLMKLKDSLGSATVPIAIRGKQYDVFDVEALAGTFRSNIQLVDINGKEIAWIVHYPGRADRDIDKWVEPVRADTKIFTHKEVISFVNDLKKLYPQGLSEPVTLARKITDNQLKHMSVYGSGYGGALSRQNVILVIQGDIQLSKRGSTFVLEGLHTYTNGDIPKGGSVPTFVAMYKANCVEFGITNMHMVIAPQDSRAITNFM